MQETASSDAEDAADGSCEQPVPFSPNITWVEDTLIPNGRIQNETVGFQNEQNSSSHLSGEKRRRQPSRGFSRNRSEVFLHPSTALVPDVAGYHSSR